MNINMKTVKLKFLHRALVLVNAYQRATSADLVRRPRADKFLSASLYVSKRGAY